MNYDETTTSSLLHDHVSLLLSRPHEQLAGEGKSPYLKKKTDI